MTSSRRRRHVGVSELARFAAAVSALLVLDLMVRLLGVRRTQHVLRLLIPLRAAPPGEGLTTGPRTERVALALDRAGSRVCRWSGRCLRRSLALWGWLRLKGVDADVQFGVRREGKALVGHAWVSHDGQPIAEDAEVLAGHVSFGGIAYR